MLGAGLKGVSSKGAPYVAGFGTPKRIGTLFLTKYLFPFELASILLLVAAVGAVVLARRRRGLEPDEQIAFKVTTPRPSYTGTMAEAAGIRPAGGDEPLKPEVEPVGTTTGDATEQQGGW
jgi:NADH-quinone oxidoreductase subunit J